MRKFLTVTLAFVFVLGLSGLALANQATIHQVAGTWNRAYVDQAGGGGNLVNSDQVASSFSNDLDIFQRGNNNTVQLDEDAGSYNDAYIDQRGYGNKVLLKQVAADYNDTDIDQRGGFNKLGRAVPCGSLSLLSKAFQKSRHSYNRLDVVMYGGNNKIGLYQEGAEYNYAKIDQRGGSNTLGAYQWNIGGFNDLTVTQTGLDIATVCQIANSGNNTAVVIQ